ncbi:MAG: ribonuclease H-like domain-containing protein [bacterium]
MDLREKLKKLEKTSSQETDKTYASSKDEVDQKKENILDKIIGGRIIENPGGKFFLKKVEYTVDEYHGKYPLHTLTSFDQNDYHKITGKSLEKSIQIKNLLFVDTETTGLMGGTGTLPFLVGIGYFKNDKFIIEQCFMRDYDDELALLKYLEELWGDYELIISFNGKSFDIPLLRTRYIMNRLSMPGIKQLDLLHAARRVWHHLESCSLSALEKEKLGIKREKDIPGREVPQLYFDYLSVKDPEILLPIFTHNRDDIASLVTLLIDLKNIFNAQKLSELSAEELYNLGHVHEKRKNLNLSIRYYERALAELSDRDDKNILCEKVEKSLSWQYKRTESWDKAVQIWQNMIKNKRGKIFPHVELAKYYEHQQKDINKAYHICRKGYEYLKEKRPLFANFSRLNEKMRHRLKRLEKKGDIKNG